jgi:hypothetical protein
MGLWIEPELVIPGQPYKDRFFVAFTDADTAALCLGRLHLADLGVGKRVYAEIRRAVCALYGLALWHG